MKRNETLPARRGGRRHHGLRLGLILLGGVLTGATPTESPRWGPLRPGDEVSLRESGGFFALDAGPRRGARATETGRGAPGLPPGQLGFVLRRIETQAQGTFLVLGPLPPARPEQEFETWIPVAFVRQIRVWP